MAVPKSKPEAIMPTKETEQKEGEKVIRNIPQDVFERSMKKVSKLHSGLFKKLAE